MAGDRHGMSNETVSDAGGMGRQEGREGEGRREGRRLMAKKGWRRKEEIWMERDRGKWRETVECEEEKGAREGSEAAGNVMCKVNENGLVEIMARKYDGGREEEERKKDWSQKSESSRGQPGTTHAGGRRHAPTGRRPPRPTRNLHVCDKSVALTGAECDASPTP